MHHLCTCTFHCLWGRKNRCRQNFRFSPVVIQTHFHDDSYCVLLRIIEIASKNNEPLIRWKTLLPFKEIGKWPLMGVTQDQKESGNVCTQLNIGHSDWKIEPIQRITNLLNNWLRRLLLGLNGMSFWWFMCPGSNVVMRHDIVEKGKCN